jgi:hypothetical protein
MNAVNNRTYVPHFAGGGPVGSSIMLPHFAGGGPVQSAAPSGERHLIDLRTDHGTVSNLRANDVSLGQLRQQALMRASVRTGKSQSWNQ